MAVSSNIETLPEEADGTRARLQTPPEALFLVVIWSGAEPRIGQALALPGGDPGPWRIFGRGAEQAGDPHPRMLLARHRPGEAFSAPVLDNPRISRVQLELRARGLDCIEVESTGRCALRHRGVQVARCEVRPGETLQLGNQLLFLCVRRPAWLGAGADPYPDFAFGMPDPHGIVGESATVWRLRQRLAFVARRPGHVLITGPSGSGKELVAHAIHALSARGDRPLVSRNAATFPEGLIDAELFGCSKNFPNYGMAERPGLIGSAHGSSLFLDEFAELSPSLQPRLLRVLDAGEYQRLGEAEPRRSDFRLLAATNRDPSALKHDLAARLVLGVTVPDLNERLEDVPLLAAHILRKAAASDRSLERFFHGGKPESLPRLELELVRRLVERRYATQVRELEGLLWDAIAASAGGTIGSPGEADSGGSDARPSAAATDAPPSPEQIQACIDQHNGKLEMVWRSLGLKNRYTLRRLIAKHHLEVRRKG